MNILFVSFGELSIAGGAVRSVSVLRALADAGHDVDVVAAKADFGTHSQINILAGGLDHPISRKQLRKTVRKALRHKTYDATHAIDDAVLYIARVTRWRRVRMVYEASRCFTGPNGIAPSLLWRLIPDHYCRFETSILHRSATIFSTCDFLSADLRHLAPHAHIVQVEDVPAHPLLRHRDIDRKTLIERFDGTVSFVVVCSILPGNRNNMRTLLLAVRKVIEKVPNAGFFIKGVSVEEGMNMASSLDISGRCVFLTTNEPEEFLAMLGIADATLFIPPQGSRYINAEIYTLLNAPGIVVAIQEKAYENLLSERNSVAVEYSTSSIAEGLLRVIQEPLLSIGIASEGQQLIADKYTYSSFKHKIRMAYHDVLKPG